MISLYSTIGLVLGLAPVAEFSIKSVDVTTLQAVSGAGINRKDKDDR